MKSRVLGLAAFSALCALSCTRVTDGIEVDVAYETSQMPQAVRASETHRVWLDRALIVLGPIELVECDTFARALWTLFAPARAKAHARQAPTNLGAPFVIDLMEGVGPGLFAGTIRPPQDAIVACASWRHPQMRTLSASRTISRCSKAAYSSPARWRT